MPKRLLAAIVFCLLPSLMFASASTKPPIKSMVIFGDSMSDNGNLTHLLKSIRQQEDPAYLTNPLKRYVFRKMDDFATTYYVPFSVLMAGKKVVQQFFDIDLAPMLAGMITVIRSIPVFPEDPYWEHRFSDGYVWNETLAIQLGINIKDEEQYYNYAFGGSWAATYDHQLTTWNFIRHPVWSLQNLISGKLIPPSLGLEVTGYLLEKGNASPDKMYLLFSGGNDYLNMLYFEDNYNPENMSHYVDYVVDGIVYSLDKLAQAGARHFTVLGVPDTGITPWYNRTMDAEVLNKATRWHNERLAKAIVTLKESYPDATFTFVDMQKVFDEMMDHAEELGITNTKDACIDIPLPTYAFTASAPLAKVFARNFVLEYAHYAKVRDGHGGFEANFHQCQHPETYAFWDAVHPTAVVHKALGNKICKALKAQGYPVSCQKKPA